MRTQYNKLEKGVIFLNIFMNLLFTTYYIFFTIECIKENDKCATNCISYNNLPKYFPNDVYVNTYCNGTIGDIRIGCIKYTNSYCDGKSKSCFSSYRGKHEKKSNYKCDIDGEISRFKCESYTNNVYFLFSIVVFFHIICFILPCINNNINLIGVLFFLDRLVEICMGLCVLVTIYDNMNSTYFHLLLVIEIISLSLYVFNMIILRN